MVVAMNLIGRRFRAAFANNCKHDLVLQAWTTSRTDRHDMNYILHNTVRDDGLGVSNVAFYQSRQPE